MSAEQNKKRFFCFALPKRLVTSAKPTLLKVERRAKQKTFFCFALPKRLVTSAKHSCHGGVFTVVIAYLRSVSLLNAGSALFRSHFPGLRRAI
ncbi:MAG: hypothetical protein IJT30_02810 [Muribaculaceae bacterium]|nr:hypothetical protein [Muribaculaceae bacterium]